MSKTFFDIGLSLDGFIAGENRSPQNPMGGQAAAIHNWMFIQKAFWEHLHTTGGEKDDQDGDLIRDVFARTGAYVMGKRMFDEGEASWPEGLFKAPVYVLTHEKRQPWVQKDNTTFYFVNDGMESAYAKAKASAGNKDIRIQGGADVLVSGAGFCLGIGAFHSVIYKIKGRIVLLHPGLAFFVGEDIDRGFEQPFGPAGFAFVEHSFAHDIGARSGKDVADEVAVLVVLFAAGGVQVFPECFLDEHPVVDGGGLTAHGVLGAAVLAGDEAVQGETDVEECLAHGFVFFKGNLLQGFGKHPGPTFSRADCDKFQQSAMSVTGPAGFRIWRINHFSP